MPDSADEASPEQAEAPERLIPVGQLVDGTLDVWLTYRTVSIECTATEAARLRNNTSGAGNTDDLDDWHGVWMSADAATVQGLHWRPCPHQPREMSQARRTEVAADGATSRDRLISASEPTASYSPSAIALLEEAGFRYAQCEGFEAFYPGLCLALADITDRLSVFTAVLNGLSQQPAAHMIRRRHRDTPMGHVLGRLETQAEEATTPADDRAHPT